MPDFDPDALLASTGAFINTMHVVRDHFSLQPKKEHIATCINYSDLLEMRVEFVRELKNTVLAFVYSQDKQRQLVAQFQEEGRDLGGAWGHLWERARNKFRPSSLQGQFSELLLCNVLQHYFRAVPLLRKMPITTNPQVERHGADAVHVARGASGRHLLYVGEAKTYDRKGEALRSALVNAIDDVVTKHYPNHRNELDLYTYEDFLTPELEALARGYQNGTLTEVEVHLVCIVTYDCKEPVEGACRDDLLNCVIGHVRREAEAAKKHPVFNRIPPALLPRMNYVIFPVQRMSDLIEQFRVSLGHVA